MEIGVIGAQSKHTELFCSLINTSPLFPRMRAVSLWGGDCPERVGWCMAEGGLQTLCDRPEEVIERSDGVIITLRRGETHKALALACLRAGKPVFVDKPFCDSVPDAAAMINLSKQCGTPLTGGSTLCLLPQIAELRERARHCRSLIISYAADCDSPFGGWNFYGSHLADLCSAICGCGAEMVSARRTGRLMDVLVQYPNRSVLLHSDPTLTEPAVTFHSWDEEYCPLGDFDRCYEYGMRAFRDMMESGVGQGAQRLLFSTRLLDAIGRSLQEARPIPLI